MEKQAIIQELREKQKLWNQIIPLYAECTKIAMNKAQTMDLRDKEAKKKYHLDPDIEIDALPVDNADAVNFRIKRRHEEECLRKAKKKLAGARAVIIIVMIIAMVISLVPHVMNFMAGNLEAYQKFGDTIGYTYYGDSEIMIAAVPTVLGLFCVGAQLLTLFFAGLAACSITKSSAGRRVHAVGFSLKGLWIALSIVVGLFGGVTWILVNPIGLVGVVLIFIMMLIFRGAMSKLESSESPYPVGDEVTQLKEAEALDAANHATNEAARKAANAKRERAFKKHQKDILDDYARDIDKYEEKIDQLTDEIAALQKQVQSEYISEKDNNLDTIDRLLNYLENGRADTLKEALHMVDMDREREKDRENQRQIAQMQMENERFMAELDRQQAQRYNDQLLAQQRAHNERMQRELDRHNAQVEREQASHNREMKEELDRLKSKLDS